MDAAGRRGVHGGTAAHGHRQAPEDEAPRDLQGPSLADCVRGGVRNRPRAELRNRACLRVSEPGMLREPAAPAIRGPRRHPTEAGRMPSTSTHIFRIRLRPKIYRDIEIESSRSLYDLAAAIVRAFDFDFDHAFGFYSKLGDYVFDSPVRYELFADLDGGSESRSAKRTKVAQAFPDLGSSMQFLFDYGDEWRFRVEVTGLGAKTPQTRYPKILKTVGE